MYSQLATSQPANGCRPDHHIYMYVLTTRNQPARQWMPTGPSHLCCVFVVSYSWVRTYCSVCFASRLYARSLSAPPHTRLPLWVNACHGYYRHNISSKSIYRPADANLHGRRSRGYPLVDIILWDNTIIVQRLPYRNR